MSRSIGRSPKASSSGLTLFVVEDESRAEGARGLELTGTVQWMAEGDRSYAVGIKFGNLTATQTAALTNALKAMGEPRLSAGAS